MKEPFVNPEELKSEFFSLKLQFYNNKYKETKSFLNSQMIMIKLNGPEELSKEKMSVILDMWQNVN